MRDRSRREIPALRKAGVQHGGWVLLLAGVFAVELPASVVLPESVVEGAEESIGTDTVATWRVESRGALVREAAEALRAVPGVIVARSGGPGGRTSVHVRGAEENYALVLVDGAAANDPTDARGGGFDPGQLVPGLPRQVTVSAGAASARHGADALSGVVLVETLAAEDARLTAGLGGDGLATFAAAIPFEVGVASVSLAVAAVRDGGSGDEPGVRQAGAVVRAAAEAGVSPAWVMVARHERTRSWRYPDDSGGDRLAVVRGLERADLGTSGVAARWRRLDSGGRAWVASAHLARHQQENRTPPVAPGVRDEAGRPSVLESTEFVRAGAAGSVEWPVAPGVEVAAGADIQREDGSNGSVLGFGPFDLPAAFELERTRAGGFAEMTWSSGNWLLQPSVRVDGATGDRLRPSVRLGARFRATPRASVRANAGTGHKLPSFYALGQPLVGDPGLRPETGRSADVAVNVVSEDGRWRSEAAVSMARFEDAIDFAPGPPPRVANLDALTTRSATVSVAWAPGDGLEVDASAAWVDARESPDGRRALRRPEWTGRAGVRWEPAGAWAAEAAVVCTGRQRDSSIATGEVTVGGWVRVDAAIRWRPSASTEVVVAADNLLDARYEEAAGFSARRLRVRLEAAFGF